MTDCLRLLWGTGGLAVKRYLERVRNCTDRPSIRSPIQNLHSICQLLACFIIYDSCSWRVGVGEVFEGIVGFLLSPDFMPFSMTLQCPSIHSALAARNLSLTTLCICLYCVRASLFECFFPLSTCMLSHKLRTSFVIYDWIVFRGFSNLFSCCKSLISNTRDFYLVIKQVEGFKLTSELGLKKIWIL